MEYVHFYINNKLITAYDYKNSSYGEVVATIKLLAYEHNVEPKQIQIKIKERAF